MPQLHLIQNSITQREFVINCRRYADLDDQFIFLNDAVFSLLDHSLTTEASHDLLVRDNSYALKIHCDARNLTQQLQERTQLVSYSDFVNLCHCCSKVVAW